MKRLPTALACLLACLPAALAAEPAPAPAARLLISAETIWTEQTITAPAGVVVEAGTTLELRGTTLAVGDQILVEPGAKLVLGPSGDRATRIHPLNATQGFWMDIQGSIVTSGEPRTIIEGLSGNGLESVVHLPGGIKLNSTAHLSDVWIRNGTAGIIVRPGAHLAMQDARIEHLYLMGVAILGTAEFDRVESVESIIGITGRGQACRVSIRNSTLANWGGNIQMVGCAATIEDTVLDRSDTNLVSGSADYLFRNVLVKGYLNAGIRADSKARVTLDNVSVHGGGRGQLGIDMQMGNHLVAHRVLVEGNTRDGITVQSGRAELDAVEVRSNGGYGLSMVGVPAPDLEGTVFGTGDARNAQGAMAVFRQFSVSVAAENGTPAGKVQMRIFDAAEREVYDGWLPAASLTATFNTYSNGTDGTSVPAGPFRYVVESDVLGAPYEGTVDLEDPYLQLRPVAAAADEGSASTGWMLRAVAFMAAIGLLVVALGVRRREKAAKAKNEPEDAPEQ